MRVLLHSFVLGFLLPPLVWAPPAAAQVLQGRVLEEGSERPVPTAFVQLLSGEGEPEIGVLADSLGRYRLEVPGPGEYRITAEQLGYEPLASHLLSIGDPDRTYPLDLVLRPAPLPVEGLEVTAERMAEVRERLRREISMNPRSLRYDPILRPDIEAHLPRSHTVSDLVRWSPTPSVRVDGFGEDTCFLYRNRRCLPVFLDGFRLPPGQVETIPLEMLEAALVLTPTESIRYQGGAVLLFSRAWLR